MKTILSILVLMVAGPGWAADIQFTSTPAQDKGAVRLTMSVSKVIPGTQTFRLYTEYIDESNAAGFEVSCQGQAPLNVDRFSWGAASDWREPFIIDEVQGGVK